MGRSKLGSVGTDFDARHWLSLDPCGLVCLALSYGLHLFALIASGLVLTSRHPLAQILYGALYVPLSSLALWSLTAAATTDPGAVPMGARPLPSYPASGEAGGVVAERNGVGGGGGGLRRRRGVRRCGKCNDNYKPQRAHHDSITGRCIVKMDHFCPWVGNAVGIMNHKFFILFILYTFLTSIVSLALILIRVIRCQYYVLLPPNYTNSSTADAHPAVPSNGRPDVVSIWHYQYHRAFDHSHPPPPHPGCDSDRDMAVVLSLSLITALFFLFTFCMLIEQAEAISTNMSKIARMKTRGGMVSRPDEYAPVATEFNEVFGGEHPAMSWRWALPLPVRFPDWAVDNIMGYEYYDDSRSRGEIVGPYMEPPDETNEESGSAVSISSGVSPSRGDGGGVGGAGASAYLGPAEVGPGMGGMDIERGKMRRELHPKDEDEISPHSRLSGGGVKKRSTGGLSGMI